MDSLETIGERVKQIRTHLKLTQHALGEKLGLSAASLSEIENNKHKPTLDYCNKLAHLFDVNLYYLLLGEGKMFTDLQTRMLSNPSVKSEIDKGAIEKFIKYFFHSSFVQFSVMALFKKLLKSDRDLIESEVNESLSGNTGE